MGPLRARKWSPVNSRPDIAIISEAGAWRHHEALLHVCRQRGTPVVRCHLNFARRIASAVANLRPSEVFGCLGDLVRLFRLVTGSSRTVIAGIAPFGVWGLLLWWLRQRNRVVYHSSWIDWRRGRVPRLERPLKIAPEVRHRLGDQRIVEMRVGLGQRGQNEPAPQVIDRGVAWRGIRVVHAADQPVGDLDIDPATVHKPGVTQHSRHRSDHRLLSSAPSFSTSAVEGGPCMLKIT